MKTEEVIASVEIPGGKYGARRKDEKFTVETSDAVQLEKLGLVSRQKATSAAKAE